MGQIKLSIISPCYNGEKFIGKYFDNLLEQTFQEYELIIVNDGSTDLSNEIIKKYRNKFESLGICVKYIYKTVNEGHAEAINDGLKLVNGKYLMWPDIDDYMYPDHIEKRVSFMEEDPELGIAIGKVAVRDIRNADKIIYYAWRDFPDNKQKLIESFVLGEDNNIGYMSGNFIVRTESLWKVYGNKSIYSDIKTGPTIQMVFPMFYFEKVGYIRECTFDYYIHGNNQHFVHEKEQYANIATIYNNVIAQMNIPESDAEKIKKMARNASNRLLLSYALKCEDKVLGKKAWTQLKTGQGIRMKEFLKYMIMRTYLLNKIYVNWMNR